MAFVIRNNGYPSKSVVQTQILSCMECAERRILNPKEIYNPDLIMQRINSAAEVRQKLETEIAEQNNAIKQSADARQKLNVVI